MRRTLTMLVAAATMTLTACGSDDSALDWSNADDPVGANSGLVWADAQTGEVHLSDGSTLSADRPISSFVVAGQGAYVVAKANKNLVEVGPKGPRKTGAYVDQAPTASPDGRYLAFIDSKAGPKDEGGVHLLTSVVVDLKTGKEVFRSTRGMGDPDKDDLTVLYENVTYRVLGMTDETVWIEPARGAIFAVDLATGKVTPTPDSEVDTEVDNPWEGPRLGAEPLYGPANQDRSWGIRHMSKPAPDLSSDPAFDVERDVLESADGTRVAPRTGAVSWYFKQWIDKATVAGFANRYLDQADRMDDRPPSSLLTCTVPDGDCTLVPDSEHAMLPEPSLY
jgi:hypothetical protein